MKLGMIARRKASEEGDKVDTPPWEESKIRISKSTSKIGCIRLKIWTIFSHNFCLCDLRHNSGHKRDTIKDLHETRWFVDLCQGPYLNDIRNIFRFLDPLPFLSPSHSRNLPVLLSRFCQPPSLPLGGGRHISIARAPHLRLPVKHVSLSQHSLKACETLHSGFA